LEVSLPIDLPTVLPQTLAKKKEVDLALAHNLLEVDFALLPVGAQVIVLVPTMQILFKAYWQVVHWRQLAKQYGIV